MRIVLAGALLAACSTAPRSIWNPEGTAVVVIEGVLRAEVFRVQVHNDHSIRLLMILTNRSQKALVRLRRRNISMEYRGRSLPATESLLAKSVLTIAPGESWSRDWIFRPGERPRRGPASVSVTGIELVDPKTDRVTPAAEGVVLSIRVP